MKSSSVDTLYVAFLPFTPSLALTPPRSFSQLCDAPFGTKVRDTVHPPALVYERLFGFQGIAQCVCV